MSSNASTGNHTPGNYGSPVKKSNHHTTPGGRKDNSAGSPQKKSPVKKLKGPKEEGGRGAGAKAKVPPLSSSGSGSRRGAGGRPAAGKAHPIKTGKTEQQFSEEREVIRALKEDLYPTKRINELDTLDETDNED